MCFCDGFVAGFEGLLLDEGTEDGGAQQTLSHRGLALVERVKESGPCVLADEEGLDELEVADGNLIEFEGGGVLFKAERVDVEGFVFLGGANVVEDGSGGDGGSVVADEAVAFERADAQLALNEGDGEVAGPDPVFNAGAGGDLIEGGGEFGAGGDEDFACAGHEYGVGGLLTGVWALELGCAEFAGGYVEEGDGAKGAGG